MIFSKKLITGERGGKKIKRENEEVIPAQIISLEFFVLRLRNFLTQSSIK